MKRKNGTNRRRSGHNRGGGVICWRCKKKIGRGNLKFWGTHPVHAGECYAWCCTNLITGKNLLQRNGRSERKGFFSRLFGL